MKKSLKVFASIFLLSGFLVACMDGEEDPDVPVNPDVPDEQMPGDDPAGDPGDDTGDDLGDDGGL